MSATVSIRGLHVVRGGRHVLHGLDLDVEAGMVTGLLGPSGSGKTTLIRSIVGIQIVASGTVSVLGRPAGTEELRSRVGYVTQAPSVYADLTVLENLRYFGRIVGVGRESVDLVLERVGLAPERDQVVATLSGGQTARASLATALLNEPDLLVLDEPTVGLDPVLRQELWSFFHELAGAGAALLVSSHVMDEADRCEELILLREGRILAVDTPQGVLASTRTSELADAFIRLVEQSA